MAFHMPPLPWHTLSVAAAAWQQLQNIPPPLVQTHSFIVIAFVLSDPEEPLTC